MFTGKPTPYTKEYIYEVNTSEQKTPFSPAEHGFSYEGQRGENRSPLPNETVQLDTSPGGKRAKGLAFTYAPPETEIDNSQGELILPPQVSEEDNRIQDISSEWNDTTIEGSLKWDDSKEEEMVKNKENLELSEKSEHKQKLGLSMFLKGKEKDRKSKKEQEDKKSKEKKEKEDKEKEKTEKDKKSNKSGKLSNQSSPSKRDSAIETDLQVDEIVVTSANVQEVENKKVTEDSVISDEEEKAVKDEAEKENKLKLAFAKKSKSKSSEEDLNNKKKTKDDTKKQKESEKKLKEKEAKEEEAKRKQKEKEEKEAAKKKAKEEKKLKEKEAKDKKAKEKAEKLKKKSEEKKSKEASPEKDANKESEKVEEDFSSGEHKNKEDSVSKETKIENKELKSTPSKNKSKESLPKESKPKKSKLSLSKIVKKKSKKASGKDQSDTSSVSSSSSDDSMVDYGSNVSANETSGVPGLVTSTPNQSLRTTTTEKFPAESSKDVSFSSETAVLELDGSPYSSPSSKQRHGFGEEIRLQKEVFICLKLFLVCNNACESFCKYHFCLFLNYVSKFLVQYFFFFFFRSQKQ